MKKYISLLVFVLPALAAAETPVFSKTIQDQSNDHRSAVVRFMVNQQNPELKRAWVQVSYPQAVLRDSDTGLAASADLAVPQLSYDPARKEIIFAKAGGNVVCATNVQEGFFSGLTYQDTGKCHLGIAPTTVSQDDGFYVRSRHGLNVTLSVQD